MAIAINISQRYTYADYLTWVDDIRRELLNGLVKLITTEQFMNLKIKYPFIFLTTI